MIYRSSLFFLMLFLSALTQAQTGSQQENSEADELLGLLEFLAEFETDDGQWVDPQLLLTEQSLMEGEDNKSVELSQVVRDERSVGDEHE